MRSRPASIRLTFAIAAVAAALLVAACGSSSPGSSTTTSSGHPRPTQAQLQQMQRDGVRFAQCMRSHGVNLPDPSSPGSFKAALAQLSGSPAFNSAMPACRQLLPNAGSSSQSVTRTPAQMHALLAFARCIRAHGFPRFPDPTSSGQLTHQMLAAARINVQQPAVLRAADACTGVTHGVVTKAMVARFVAGQ